MRQKGSGLPGRSRTERTSEKGKEQDWTEESLESLVNMELSAARNRSLAGGMDGYQTKPIRPQELDEVLAGYLGKRT
jgi:CheY-like chemotaxis protein